MNIFVTSSSPIESAQVLPDRHVVKMPIECCQILACVLGENGLGLGTIPKVDKSPYSQKSHLHHRCTQWAMQSGRNSGWLLTHGMALCDEYKLRYDKDHGCVPALQKAALLMVANDVIDASTESPEEHEFVRCMEKHPDLQNDLTIGNFEAYKKFLARKPWLSSNYLRNPNRKPDWA